MGNSTDIDFARYCYLYNVISVFVSKQSSVENFYFELLRKGFDSDDVVGFFQLSDTKSAALLGEYPTTLDIGTSFNPYKFKAKLIRRHNNIAVFKVKNFYFRVQESF